MIPLRLLLENFMCYREKTEIDFRGSIIWALSGHNGSGKSALLDAMRYVLYGEHRAGKQKIEALIHRGSVPASSFMIEFDFAIGENEYRVKRTYSQKKKGTTLALHLAGPDAPTPGRPSPQPIPGTEKTERFNTWVLETIGLDERAFTVSILLLQGQSDKLLKLERQDRHEVLTHIIDLSRYEALAKRALDKQRAQEGSVKTYKEQLDGLEKIDETSIGTVAQQVCEAQEKKEQSRTHQIALVVLREKAQFWQQLQEEEKSLLQKMTRIEPLLAQSEQIESNATRLAVLQKVIPSLTLMQQKQVDSTRFQLTIKQNSEQATTLEINMQILSEKQQKVQQQNGEVRACYQKQDQEHKAMQADLLALEVPCNDIARLHGKQHESQELSKNISTFAPDLEQQQQHLKNRLDEMSHIETAVPLLQHFVQFRHDWQQATQDFDRLTRKLGQHLITQKQISTQLQTLQGTRETLREQVSSLQSNVASQRTLFTECQKRSKRFHSIEGEATCSYCGQLLTIEHLAVERQRIQEELQENEHSFQECSIRYTAAQTQQKTVDDKIKRVQEEEKKQKQVSETLTLQQNSAVRKRDTAYTEAKHQLELLAPEYLEQMQGIGTTFIDADVCILALYPTSQDLNALSLQRQDKPALNQKLQAVEHALAQRQELRRKQEYILSEIEPLLQIYPPERARTLLEKREQALQRGGKLSEILKKLSIEIQQQEQQISEFVDEDRQAREEQSRLEQALAIIRTKLQNAQQALRELQEQLPVEWQVHISHLSSEMLAEWQEEIRALQGATEQYQALIEARQHQSQYKHMQEELGRKQHQIPQEARRIPEQVQEEIDQINALYQALEKQEQGRRAELQRLQGIREQRRERHQQWAVATHLASCYKDLASLLGRDGLQHYLLQNAEAGIVYHANEMLDRISGGTLRLELSPNAETKIKALDMVAYNSAINAHEPQSIRLLSGSQQFRVAISLAIGIGQYLGNTNHRVETIMIDEGFGSLDTSSRDEMTQALQALEDDFKCVIVVSHQNEFFDKFPNRYEVELVDGRTRITLV